MARLLLVALSVTALFAAGSKAGMSPLEYGMEMSVRAYDAVCWYENLKQFPHTNTKGFNQCSGQQQSQKEAIETGDFFKKNPDKKEEYFGKWTDDMVIGGLPKPYKDACGKYLSDSKAKPPADESDALNDGGGDYPYRGYAQCLLHTLREQHGDDSIMAVKSEKTHSRKNWMKAINDRDNEFRARHGAEPLKLNKDLNDAAQKWADQMASQCNMYHSKGTDADRQWKGAGTGESISAGMGDDKEIAAYTASDGWYEEVKDYPFPDGFKGSSGDSLFMKIGHFTQTVWKGSKYVGYGYAFSQKCKDQGKYSRFVAARYSPAGNVEGKYTDNVGPAKD